MKLEDLVLETVKSFVKSDQLFTALDVSNKVRETLPIARHREVRDLVRGLFHSEIESVGYARTPIQVTLAGGATAEALLYHPLADSWDLDVRYASDRRAAEAVGFVKFGTVPATPAPVVAPPPQPASNKDLWESLFQASPSMFPDR